MLDLLRAEALVLRNAFGTHEGRQALTGYVIVMVCIALGAAGVGRRIVMSDAVLAAMRDDPGFPVGAFVAAVLSAPLLLVSALVLGTSRREMFLNGQVDLLLGSPASRTAIAARAFVRLTFSALSLQLAAVLPFAVGFAIKAELGPRTLLLFPVACLVLLAPLIALAMLAQSVVVRLFGNPILKFTLQAIGVAAMLATYALFLLGMISETEQKELVTAQIRGVQALPFFIDWPVGLLLGARVGHGAGAVLGCVGLLLVPWPVLLLVGKLYGGCRERLFITERPVLHRLRAPSKNWPVTAWVSITRKDFVQFTRDRGGFIALLFVMGVQLMVLKTPFGGIVHETSPLPVTLQQAFGLILSWQFVALLVGTLNTLGFAGGEGHQLPLLATAPISASVLLRGKCFELALPYFFLLLVVLAGAPFVVGATPAALLVFLAGAVPLAFIQMGIIAAVGTSPRLVRNADGVPLAESLAAIGPIIVVSLVFGALMGVTHYVKKIVTRWHREGSDVDAWTGLGLVGSAWIVGACLLGLGLWLAIRNLRVVLSPQR